MSAQIVSLDTGETIEYYDVPNALRNLADAIERGDYGSVRTVALAMFGDHFDVFGFGPDSEATDIHYLLACALRKLEDPMMNRPESSI